MKNIIKNIIAVLLVISLYGCGETHYIIYIVNSANHTISCNLALGGDSGYYPDTLLKTDLSVVKIKPDKYYSFDSDFKWEKIFSKLPKDTMSVFIFHTDTLNKFTWKEIKDMYLILKRYDLSYDDLVRLNNRIPYPPDERMKNMKMQPPCGNE